MPPDPSFPTKSYTIFISPEKTFDNDLTQALCGGRGFSLPFLVISSFVRVISLKYDRSSWIVGFIIASWLVNYRDTCFSFFPVYSHIILNPVFTIYLCVGRTVHAEHLVLVDEIHLFGFLCEDFIEAHHNNLYLNLSLLAHPILPGFIDVVHFEHWKLHLKTLMPIIIQCNPYLANSQNYIIGSFFFTVAQFNLVFLHLDALISLMCDVSVSLFLSHIYRLSPPWASIFCLQTNH